MNVHEYQAKQLLRRYGVPVPRGDVAHTPQEAETVAEELDGPVWVVKAQIHAGGRGKAGGIKICRSVKEVIAKADAMLGMKLVTRQTGPQGKEVKTRLYRAGHRDRARALSRHADRPAHRRHRLHRLHRRRHGYRGSGGKDTRTRSSRCCCRPRHRCRASTPGKACLRPRPQGPRSAQVDAPADGA